MSEVQTFGPKYLHDNLVQIMCKEGKAIVMIRAGENLVIQIKANRDDLILFRDLINQAIVEGGV